MDKIRSKRERKRVGDNQAETFSFMTITYNTRSTRIYPSLNFPTRGVGFQSSSASVSDEIMNVEGKTLDVNQDTQKANMDEILGMVKHQIVCKSGPCNCDHFDLSRTDENEEAKHSIPIHTSSNCEASGDIHQSIRLREKGSHLTIKQRLYLAAYMRNHPKSLSDTAKEFLISPQTLRNIKLCNYKVTSKDKSRYSQSTIRKVDDYVKATNHPFSSTDVTNHMLAKHKEKLSSNHVRYILKNHLNLSYKRVNSRPCNVDLDLADAKRVLYCIRLMQSLDKDTILANVDESIINHDTKLNYSWTSKGKQIEVLNKPVTGFVSMILTIFSNGAWFCSLVERTVNSDIFCDYVTSMLRWVGNSKAFNGKRILLVMDNCSSHKSKKSKELLQQLDCDIAYIPAYTPQLAPVEMAFNSLKRKFLKSCRKSRVSATSDECKERICEAMRKIKKREICGYFKKMLETIKVYLNSITISDQ